MRRSSVRYQERFGTILMRLVGFEDMDLSGRFG